MQVARETVMEGVSVTAVAVVSVTAVAVVGVTAVAGVGVTAVAGVSVMVVAVASVRAVLPPPGGHGGVKRPEMSLWKPFVFPLQIHAFLGLWPKRGGFGVVKHTRITSRFSVLKMLIWR